MSEEKVRIKIIKIEGTPEWMMSFGDLMSCLLVFFVLLLTFSSSKPAQLMDMMGDYVAPGGTDETQDAGDTSGTAGALKRIAVESEDEAPMKLANLIIGQKFREFKERLYKLGFKHDVTFSQTEDGFYVDVEEKSLFAEGKGGISADATLLMQSMANAALSIKKELRILNRISTGGDETEFSSANVMRSEERLSLLRDYLSSKYGVRLGRMSFGSTFIGGNANFVRFLIADKLEGKAYSMSDLTKPKG